MHIMIGSTTYYPGLNGQAIFTVNLAEGLAKRGHEVTVVFPSDEGRAYSRMRNSVRLEGIRSIKLTFLHPDSFIPVFSAKTIRSILSSYRPDIVHIQDHYPLNRAIVRETLKRGIKLLGTNHFMPENLAPYIPGPAIVRPAINSFLWRWMLQTYNHMEIVTTQSRAAAKLTHAQGLRVPAYPVSCGIDLGRFHPDSSIDRLACRARYGIDPNRTVFLFVGRVDKEKRVDVLLRALHRLQRDDIQLVVAGRGAASDELQALSKSLSLGDRVRFTGFIPNEDLHVLLNSVDIFTMPSEAELLSIASLEAMACARPVLLADAVALPELVTHGVNGFLFEPGNPEDASRYMSLLADQRREWGKMGRASLEKARDHSLENTIRRYEELYQLLLEGVPAQPTPIFSHISQ
jgi:1,2-diacylglycerol 3-alpha-glucosyltransferase